MHKSHDIMHAQWTL